MQRSTNEILGAELTADRETTVLVHGLWLHGAVMEFQRRQLCAQGLTAVSFSYPSVRVSLSDNATQMARFASSLSATRINWVGHSLGGLLILHMLERASALPPGRVVLQGVPAAGSYAGRTVSSYPIASYALGKSITEWLRSAAPGQFPGREIGVIAGSLSVGLGRLFAPRLPAPNDGVVTLDETKLDAACDRIVLPVSHSWMLASREVARQTAEFMRDGRFIHDNGR